MLQTEIFEWNQKRSTYLITPPVDPPVTTLDPFTDVTEPDTVTTTALHMSV